MSWMVFFVTVSDAKPPKCDGAPCGERHRHEL